MMAQGTNIWQQAKQRIFKLSVLATALGALGLTACTTTTTKTTPTTKPVNNTTTSEYLDADSFDSFDSLEGLLYATEVRAVENDRLAILKHGNVWKRLPLGYRMGLDKLQHSRISAQRNWFVSRQPYLDRLSARASRYLFYTVREAERRGLPTELALLPIIESSYDPAATSSAAAAGLWQFIPSTGRSYGLTQNSTYDGRRDVVASTQAAYDFLSALYNQFGSWELALAAYNAGPGTISKAIKRNEAAGLATDYWSLRLPKETMDYVPRFIAVAQIVKNQADYGVELPAIANRPHFREIILSQPVNLNDVARITGLDRAELYSLNPGYRGDMIDYNSSMRLLIPADLNPNIDAQLKGKVNNTWLTTKVNQNPTPTQSGQYITLPTQTSTPPKMDNDSNPINTSRAEPPISTSEREKILALLADEEANQQTETVSTSPAAVKPVVQPIPVEHKVDLTKVETNLTVAEKTGQEVEKTFIYPTAVTDKVPENSDIAQLNKDKPIVKKEKELIVSAPKGKRTTYVVRSGDTLINIASRYGVNWRDIATWNKIEATAPLLAGTPLYLYDAKPVVEAKKEVVKEKKPEVYTVQSGDTLTGVAQRFDMNIKQLADYNNLTVTSNLIAGQKLSLIAPKKVEPKTESKVEAKSVVPNKKVAVETYKVQRGETLTMLANRYEMTTQELANLTAGLNANSALKAGQTINVPKGFKATQTTKVTKAEKLATPEVHIVKSGETLTSIAQKYHLQLDYLAGLNGLERNTKVRSGQKLKLTGDLPKAVKKETIKDEKRDESKPKVEQKGANYVVKSGESLISIAKREGISLAELAQMNGLTTRTQLKQGQKIIVPERAVTTKADDKKVESKKAEAKKSDTKAETKKDKSVAYKVKSGDSLIALAKKHGITPAELAKLNGLKPNASLQLGQTIQVPNK